MKSIILCADDYGQSTSISQAIIQLLQQKRLSATSCLTTSAHWPAQGVWLKSPNIQADIGLHINLTEGRPLSQVMQQVEGEYFPTLLKWMIKSHLHQINFDVIFAEVNAQIDQFEAVMGRFPDFIDGHQHVHQFPIIREAVLKIYEERLRKNPHCYIRCTYTPHFLFNIKNNAYMKQCIIQLSGAIALKKQLLQRKIPHNTSFSGIYDFKHSASYPRLFLTFLKQISDNGLIMCHPGLMANHLEDDLIGYSRQDEYQYFLSEAFLEACHEEKVVLKNV